MLSIFAAFSITTPNLCNKYFSHFTLHQLSNCFTVEAWDSTVGISVPTWRDGNKVFHPMTVRPEWLCPKSDALMFGPYTQVIWPPPPNHGRFAPPMLSLQNQSLIQNKLNIYIFIIESHYFICVFRMNMGLF